MKKKELVLFIVLTCLTTLAKGQSSELQPIIKDAFNRSGTVHPQGIIKFILDRPENKRSMLFSIIISTSKSGSIESIQFTQGAYLIDSVLTLSKLQQYLTTKAAATFAHYKNAVIIVPVWLRDIEGTTIEVSPEFLTSYDDLIPRHLSKVKKPKSVFMLQTIRLDVGRLSY